jgi:hypothetical protein
MDVTVRHTEPEDYIALHRIFSGPRAIAGTLQMPLTRAETWRAPPSFASLGRSLHPPDRGFPLPLG